MKPKKINHRQGRLFETRLSDQLNPKHSLLQLLKRLTGAILKKIFPAHFLAKKKVVNHLNQLG